MPIWHVCDPMYDLTDLGADIYVVRIRMDITFFGITLDVQNGNNKKIWLFVRPWVHLVEYRLST